MRVDLPYLVVDTDRHGNERIYVRRHGRKVRIRVPPGDAEDFTEAYSQALKALESGKPQQQGPKGGAPTGTLGWLAATYFASVEFTSLPEDSQDAPRHHRALLSRAD